MRPTDGGDGRERKRARRGSRTGVTLTAGAFAVLGAVGATSGSPGPPGASPARPSADTLHDADDRVAVVEGLSGPEAVHYDPEADVWLISNFGPREGSDPRDGNGFVSRVAPDGTVRQLRFMVGTESAPLHMPRGMAIRGDTVLVADVDGVHAFDRATGEHLVFVDFRGHEPGFLNDVALDPRGTPHVTDTGRGRVYRIEDGRAAVAVEDSRTGPPNGIAWDASSERFLLAPWGGGTTLRSWDPATGAFEPVAELDGADFDGVEIVDDLVLVANQRDSTLLAVDRGAGRVFPLIRVAGPPADIAVDPGRRRVAVPYISLNRVDVWELPGR